MIKNLILSGGASKCIVYVGAIRALADLHMLEHIEHFAGTSGGALLVSLLVLNYSIDEIEELYYKLNLKDLIDIKGDSILRFFNDYGLDSGNTFIHLIKIVIKKKTGNAEITFKELYELTHKHLIITGTCVEKECVEYFNHILTPDMPVYLAIRISTCIPFVFNRVVYNNYTYIDGGFIEYFPIHYFSNISESLALGIENNSLHDTVLISSIENYVYKMLCGLYRANQENVLHTCTDNTIIYKTDINGLDVLDIETKKNIITYGYAQTNNYFADTIIKNKLDSIINLIIKNEHENEHETGQGTDQGVEQGVDQGVDQATDHIIETIKK